MAQLSKIKVGSTTYNVRDDVHTWGGRNLLQGSHLVSPGVNIVGWCANGANLVEQITENGVPIIHFKNTLSNSKYIPSIVTRNVVNLEWGKTYIFSMDIKFDKDIIIGASVPQHYHLGSKSDNGLFSTINNGKGVTMSKYTPAANITIAANTWQHYERWFTTATSAPDSSLPYPMIRCFVYGAILTTAITGEVNGWAKNAKVECANKATDWSPAPEDIAHVNGECLELIS